MEPESASLLGFVPQRQPTLQDTLIPWWLEKNNLKHLK
jgi:hypothetical protein